MTDAEYKKDLEHRLEFAKLHFECLGMANTVGLSHLEQARHSMNYEKARSALDKVNTETWEYFTNDS